MNSRLIIAAGDISSSPILLKWFRGKTAKEIYRCGKGVLFTGSVAKPLGFAAIQVPRELTKGVVYTAIGQIGEGVLGYISGIGFVRYLYKVSQPEKLKATARLMYNVGCLPITLYSKGIGGAFDLLQLSKLEKMWFGEPIYIFDDNRLWVETNFTIGDIFAGLEDS
uniref:hypothetical protein n=1 Tax=Haslea pseudostrearia TaxID=197756 RepID=UPI0021FE34E3|nr:hypothetical protein ON958_pgp048 [Haslea pseudostrearia]UXN44652.1 hypothetical protein [Haslea pseudostrearia]